MRTRAINCETSPSCLQGKHLHLNLPLHPGWVLSNRFPPAHLPPDTRPYCHHHPAQTLTTVPTYRAAPLPLSPCLSLLKGSQPSISSLQLCEPSQSYGSCSFPQARLPAPPVCCLCCVQGCGCTSVGILTLTPFEGEALISTTLFGDISMLYVFAVTKGSLLPCCIESRAQRPSLAHTFPQPLVCCPRVTLSKPGFIPFPFPI